MNEAMARLFGLSIPLVLGLSYPANAASTFTVQVAANQTQGTFKDLLGVNKPPNFAGKTPGTSYDGSNLYTSFGVSQIRLHDSGLDLCSIYKAATRLNVSTTPQVSVTSCTITASGAIPHFMWTPTSSADADLNNPDNYDFTSADDAILKSVNSGAKIYLGLAQNYNGPNDTTDSVAWAKVATNIYKHVIGKFKPTTGIAVDPAYIEIHNEPDGGFWRGSVSTFNTLYIEMNLRIRAAAAEAGKNVLVGGPGFTRDVLAKSKQTDNVAYGFINNVGASTLDYYSAHLYDKCGSATLQSSATFLRSLRALVDGQGGVGKPIHISEWNIGLGTECGNSYYADQRNQSYASGLLTLMQDPAQNIQAAHYYAGVTVMSLFDFTSVSGKVRVNPASWAFWAHAKLNQNTVLSTTVCPVSGSCAAGYAADANAVVAVTGQKDNRITSIVSNDSADTVNYTLRLSDLSGNVASARISNPPQGAQDIAVSGNPFIADSSALAGLLSSVTSELRQGQTVSSGKMDLTLSLPAHSVQVVEIWPGLATVPASNAQMDCLFNWGETQYPSLLSPAKTASQFAAGYYYRYYSGTKAYLGISSADQNLYYYSSTGNSGILNLGAATQWISTAGC